MSFDVPRWWRIGVLVSLVLITVGGALGAVEQGMRENLGLDGCGGYYGPARAEGVDDAACRSGRVEVTIVDAVARATLGPGIAVAVLAGVYLLATALSARRPRHGGSA